MGRAVWLLVGVAACGSGKALVVRAVVRDSAGIAIVENTAPLAADSIALRIDSVPAVDIGGTDDPHAEFGRIAGAIRLPDGGIAVADGGNQELKLFDSTGAWRRLAGGKGGGPGEFENLGGLYHFGGDSLATYDWDHRRISVFTIRGDLVREMILPQGEMGGGFPHVIGMFWDGEILVGQGRFAGESGKSGIHRDTMPLFRYTRSAELADSIGWFPGSEFYQDIESSGGKIRSVVSARLPFGLVLTMVPAGDRLFVGTGGRYEIAQHDRSGGLTRLIRRVHQPLPVSAADIATYKHRHLAGFRAGMEDFRDRTMALLDRMTYPETKPAYDGFVVGDNGALWVRRYDQPAIDLPSRYDLFDRDGQWLGHVTFPPRFSLLDAGPGYALGVWKDPDDVEYVRLYRLLPVL
jgi:hypothetical protein